MIPVLIVPVLARPDLLERMLDSIDHPIGTLIVIDNGHTWPGPFEPRPGIDNAYLLRMPSNLGVPASWNLGIKATPFAPWWLVANFDITWPAGALAEFCKAGRRDALVLSGGQPEWCAFAIGDKVVEQVGLFDEAIHPAYFEDTDMERRVGLAGIDIVRTGIPVRHDNSSTLRAGYEDRNAHTFAANMAYYRGKVATDDRSQGGWSLKRRRELTWD